jgi:hypothetical protein
MDPGILKEKFVLELLVVGKIEFGIDTV